MKLQLIRWSAFLAGGSIALQSCSGPKSPEESADAIQETAAAESTPRQFDDCWGANWCPTMISLAGATFVMGSPKTEIGRFDDEDQHTVAVKSFAMARSPITRAQWSHFVQDTRRATPRQPCAYAPAKDPSWKDPGYPQAENHPVVCVTWNDAQDYAQWLSRRTGHNYRLPTDEEWEFAARAGSTTAYPWGATASHAFANYGLDECCGPLKLGRDQWEYTSPVGSFPPNAFGLVDMHGNIFQWVQTCADTFEKLPLRKDGGGCTYRYARGGAYGERPAVMRSAAKNMAPPDENQLIENYRSAGFGFRVARDL